MFGMNESMMKLLLGQAKTHIKAKGIKFIAIVDIEGSNEIAIRAFKEKAYIITESMLEEIRFSNQPLCNRIVHLNTKEGSTEI